MNRMLVAVAVASLVASAALADIAPPIPKGLKRVPTAHRITIEKEVADYTFFTVEVIDSFRGKTRNPASPAKLDPKNPVSLTTSVGASASRSYELVAVPKGAGKGFDNEKDFHKAITDGKVAGMVKAKTPFSGSGSADIKESDPRKEVVREYKLEKVDAKEGLVVTPVKEAPKSGSVPPKDGSEESDEPSTEVAAWAPKNGVWVAGIAATFALVFAGVWFAGRNRRAP